MTTPTLTKLAALFFAAVLLSTSGRAEDDTGAIIQATKDYVKKEADVSDARVTVQVVANGYARVLVEGTSDPATAYLKEKKGKWKVLSLGTAFSPEDLTEMGIPASVRGE